MNTVVRDVNLEDLQNEIFEGDENWIIISTINFEECSVYFTELILTSIKGHHQGRIKFFPIKLTSKRASPWSALELVKNMFVSKVQKLASKNKIEFSIEDLEYPAGKEMIYKILNRARRLFNGSCNLIVDISAMPREMGTYFSDYICCINSPLVSREFDRVFTLITPPERVTSRTGYGPFSVGQPKCIYNHGLTESLTSSHKVNLLVFPGYEGFEAKTVCDLFLGHNANITCALSCFNYSYNNNLRNHISNQSLFLDHINDKISLRYYFSRNDILRVGLDFMESSVNLFDEFQEKEHALLIAPFGPKTAIFLGSYLRKKFVDDCFQKNPHKEVFTDVIVMPTSQYVSLYSRGHSQPCIFEVSFSTKQTSVGEKY